MREAVRHRDRPADGRLRLVDHRFAGRDADAERQRVAEAPLEAPPERERRMERPLGVILLGDRSAEDGDDRAAGCALDPAAALVDLARQLLPEPVEEGGGALGVADPERRQRAAQVGGEDGDELPFRHRLGNRCGRRRRRGRGLERGILPEDRALELLQLPARLDPEAADERLARIPVGGQRLGLPAGAVEREHLLPPEPLAERLCGDEPLELPDQLGVPAQGQIGLDPLLERVQAQLLEPGDLALDELLVAEVGERRAAPQPQRVAQARGRELGVAVGERAPPVGEQALEPERVQLVRLQTQHVAGRARREQLAVAVQRLAQLRHPDADGRLAAQRLVGAPELVEQPLLRHDLVRAGAAAPRAARAASGRAAARCGRRRALRVGRES